MTRADLRYTADDYRALPSGGPRYQLVDGELLRMTPAPSYRHQALVWELGTRLRSHVRALALGDVVGAPIDVYLSDVDVLQPELLFLARDHLDRIADDGVHGPPDLVVEVLSPSTRNLDLGAKRKTYARHGVLEYWVLDPDARSVTAPAALPCPCAGSASTGPRTIVRGEVGRAHVERRPVRASTGPRTIVRGEPGSVSWITRDRDSLQRGRAPSCAESAPTCGSEMSQRTLQRGRAPSCAESVSTAAGGTIGAVLLQRGRAPSCAESK